MSDYENIHGTVESGVELGELEIHHRMLGMLERAGATGFVERVDGNVGVSTVSLEHLTTFGIPTEGRRTERYMRQFGVLPEGDTEPLNNEEQEARDLLEGYPETTPQRIPLDIMFIPGESEEQDSLIVTDGLHRNDVMKKINELGYELGAEAIVRPGNWFQAMTALIEANSGKPELGTSRRYAWYEILWDKTAPLGLQGKMHFTEAFGRAAYITDYRRSGPRLSSEERAALDSWMLSANMACDTRERKKKTDDSARVEWTEYQINKRRDDRVQSWARQVHDDMAPLRLLSEVQRNQIFDYPRLSERAAASSDLMPAPEKRGYTTTKMSVRVAEAFPGRPDIQNALLDGVRAHKLNGAELEFWVTRVLSELQAIEKDVTSDGKEGSTDDAFELAEQFDVEDETRVSRLGALLAWGKYDIRAARRLASMTIDPKVFRNDLLSLAERVSQLQHQGLPADFNRGHQLRSDVEYAIESLRGLLTVLFPKEATDENTVSVGQEPAGTTMATGMREEGGGNTEWHTPDQEAPWSDLGAATVKVLNYIVGDEATLPRSVTLKLLGEETKSFIRVAAERFSGTDGWDENRYQEVLSAL